MVDYLEAIKRPFTDLKKLGLTILFMILPIVNFLSNGYFLECAKSSLENKKILPEWINFRDKFIKGFLLVIIKIIYAIPLLIISIIFLGSILKETINEPFIQAIQTGNISNIMPKLINVLLQPSVITSFIIVLIIAVLTSYIVPLAIISYTLNWKFNDIFNFRQIFRKAFTKQYFLAWLVVALYSILVLSIASFIPIIGEIIALSLIGITSYTIFGSVYKEI